MSPFHFTEKDALAVGQAIGIDWQRINFTQFRFGLEVELEHGLRDPETDVTGNDPIKTGKIAWAHLKEMPDYYSRLATLEAEPEPAAGAERESAPRLVDEQC